MEQTLLARFSLQHLEGPCIQADLQVPTRRPHVTVLLGPSGCGKTSILRCLAGLDRPQRGCIQWEGEVWANAEARTFLRPEKRGVGYVSQDYALFPHLTVRENIGYGLRRLALADREERVGQQLHRLGLSALADRLPHRLSGGQQQRTALARALVLQPRLLLLDEPLAALDVALRRDLRVMLHQEIQQRGIPLVLVTHDVSEADELADQVIRLAPPQDSGD